MEWGMDYVYESPHKQRSDVWACVLLFVPIVLHVNTDEHHACACCCEHIF